MFDEIRHLLLRAFEGLPDPIKLLVFIILIVALIALAIWKFVDWQKKRECKTKLRLVEHQRDELQKRFDALTKREQGCDMVRASSPRI
jgi:hypothetical protein